MPKGIVNATGRGNRYKHGLTYGADGKRTKVNAAWLALRQRCNNPKHPDYPYYGAKGIRVSPLWDDFVAFHTYVGEPPTPKHTIDRIDTAGHYEPGNVRWATRRTQSINRPYCKLKPKQRRKIRVLYASGCYSQETLGALYGVTQGSISQIVRGKR